MRTAGKEGRKAGLSENLSFSRLPANEGPPEASKTLTSAAAKALLFPRAFAAAEDFFGGRRGRFSVSSAKPLAPPPQAGGVTERLMLPGRGGRGGH